MAKFYVEYHKRSDGECVVEQDTLQLYSQIQSQHLSNTHEVLSSCPRVEYYIKDSEGSTVGCFMLMHSLDMHHGPVAVFAAHWISPMHRRKPEIHRLVMWYLKRFCTTFGVTKYQRSRHLSPTVQIQITKEV